MEHTKALNGYKPRSYGDVVAIATLISMLLAVIAWGLKLESSLDATRTDITNLRIEVAKGILPRADERIKALEIRIAHLEGETNHK